MVLPLAQGARTGRGAEDTAKGASGGAQLAVMALQVRARVAPGRAEYSRGPRGTARQVATAPPRVSRKPLRVVATAQRPTQSQDRRTKEGTCDG